MRSAENRAAWMEFSLGDLRCMVVSDGSIEVGPPRDYFPTADADELDDYLRERGRDPERFDMAQNVLYVEAGDSRILVNVGLGTDSSLGVERFGTDAGLLPENLRAAGVDPSDIDIVALTHLHPDHAWGLVHPDGTPIFPNASIALNRTEMAYWTDEQKIRDARDDVSRNRFLGARKNLAPYASRLMLLEGGETIAPGVQAVLAAGHTPGHMVYRVESGGSTLLSWGDTCHDEHLLMWRDDLELKLDYAPEARDERRRIFALLSETGSWVHSFHFPFPGLGRVERVSDGYRWHAASVDSNGRLQAGSSS